MPSITPSKLVICLLTVFLSGVLSANTLTFSSGTNQVKLIELYTSEGCSSCPPADRWLSTFKEDPALWNRIIPVAFHVDYWNYLGWKDPFSQRQNSRRQRHYHSTGNINSVYTPGFVLNGEEWRGWFLKRRLPEQNSQAGELTVTLKDGDLTANYQPLNGQHQLLVLNIALLGFDISTRVKAGENRGRTLKHDFVVLSHYQNRSGNLQWMANLPAQTHDGPLALAAWVSTPDNQRPLQATGGWL